VSRNKAKVQLDAHLAEDPLPLRKAKLTLEASQKKADKARAPFQAAREKVEAALEEARKRMVHSKREKKRERKREREGERERERDLGFAVFIQSDVSGRGRGIP
jgi:hypothetical protein